MLAESYSMQNTVFSASAALGKLRAALTGTVSLFDLSAKDQPARYQKFSHKELTQGVIGLEGSALVAL
jgi:hypothetical protein